MSGPGVVGTVEPMSDVDDLYDLRDNLDGLRSRLDRAGVAADPGPLRAHDESGAVSVETDAKGVLRSVTIAMDWSAKVAPQALGAAVLDAVAALATQRLEEVGRALEESFDGPAPARTPLPAQYQTVAGHLEERLGEGRSQEEIDAFWAKLSAVPEAEQCGWCKDKFGLSWQITPARMDEMMNGSAEQVKRVTQAFLQMKKFDLAALEKAYQG